MAFQSRFRETERHAFGERGGQSGDAPPGEPNEVRILARSLRRNNLLPSPDRNVKNKP